MWKNIFSFDIHEWHAFWIGFGDGASFFTRKDPPPSEYDNPLKREWHYYMIGRPLGMWVSSFIIIGLIIWLLRLGGIIS